MFSYCNINRFLNIKKSLKILKKDLTNDKLSVIIDNVIKRLQKLLKGGNTNEKHH